MAELKATRTEREQLAARPLDADTVDPEEALDWLASLARLWRETSDEGRRRLAVATFTRLGVVSSPRPASHRIVSVEATEEAERRGLVLALPASIEVTVVGDTGEPPTADVFGRFGLKGASGGSPSRASVAREPSPFDGPPDVGCPFIAPGHRADPSTPARR